MRRVLTRALLATAALVGTLFTPAVAEPPGLTTDAVPQDYDGPAVCAEYAWGAGFRGDRLVKAIAVGMAESGCRTHVRGPNPADQGAWQVRAYPERVARYGDLLVPENNARAAFDLSAQGTDWQTHWAASNCGDASNAHCYAHYWGVSVRAARRWALPDVNGDAFGDLVGVDGNGQLFGYHNASQVGSGQPFTSETWRLAGSDWRGAVKVAKGDINGDGFEDLVAAQADGRLLIYNNGSLVHPGGWPYLGATWSYDGDWSRVRHLAVSDVSGDGYADLVVVQDNGQLVVYENGSLVNPGGRPFAGQSWAFGDWSDVRLLTVTDANGDGYGDITAVDGAGQLFGYANGSLVNPGRAPFGALTWRLAGSDWSGVRALTSTDTNADRLGDLVAISGDGVLEVYQSSFGQNPDNLPYLARSRRIPGDWSAVRSFI